MLCAKYNLQSQRTFETPCMYIKWEKPDLNQQVKDINVTHSP